MEIWSLQSISFLYLDLLVAEYDIVSVTFQIYFGGKAMKTHFVNLALQNKYSRLFFLLEILFSKHGGENLRIRNCLKSNSWLSNQQFLWDKFLPFKTICEKMLENTFVTGWLRYFNEAAEKFWWTPKKIERIKFDDIAFKTLTNLFQTIFSSYSYYKQILNYFLCYF